VYTVLRIITGEAKGKKLLSLEGEATRPTSDRIKGAMFSSIQFDVSDRRVLDLFAGTGQLGLEAMSRGAESVHFVDMERDAMEVVKANCRSTGYFEKCRYSVSDWRNYIRKASGRDRFDLVFIDPPYSLKCCGEAADRLASAQLIIPGALLVLECGEERIDMDSEAMRGFELVRSAEYGKKTAVYVLIYRGRE
jgi:16S rRNA (guanine(966)-N(2))-methyltransferase RsmD